ncbi:MAG: ribbon-helix-helix domain-containing protein [Candidatus Bathyarchaeota archaeon]|nr:ribbon-helix-helix domain-containing protein [Candidatus Bathyarchaeota archaeon]
MEKRNRGTFWSVKVPSRLNSQLDRYIEEDAFETKSEFIRQAVREKLREELALAQGEERP